MLAAQIGRGQTWLMLFQYPIICSSVNLLRFIGYLLQLETDPYFKSEATLGERAQLI